MPSDKKRRSIIFSAPSGAGKTTIVRHLLGLPELNLAFSVSATTRALRGSEEHGHDYYFLSQSEFQTHIENGDLVEWEEVYPGKFYGTLKSELERLWEQGKTVVFDVDVVGGSNLKNVLGEDALAIFIQPPSLDVLRSRLEGRGTETQERIEERMAKASWEMEQKVHFDRILINDDLLRACETAADWIEAYTLER